MFYAYPLLRQYLDGTTSSGLYEARLAHESFGGECHVFRRPTARRTWTNLPRSAGMWCSTPSRSLPLTAESSRRGRRMRPARQSRMLDARCARDLRPVFAGLAARRDGGAASRRGSLRRDGTSLPHALRAGRRRTRDDAGRRGRTFRGSPAAHEVAELWRRAPHHAPGCDIARLERCIRRVQERYGVTVYLEPGEAVALDAGYLDATVLDIVENGMKIAILDTSAACHMPDVAKCPTVRRLRARARRVRRVYVPSGGADVSGRGCNRRLLL